MTTQATKREFEVRYWYGYPQSKKPSTKGFPKTELGKQGGSLGAAGAVRAITSGYAAKVQCIHRESEKVLWTAMRVKVPGCKVYGVRLIKGEDDGR